MYVHQKEQEDRVFVGLFSVCVFFLRGLFLLITFQVPGNQQQLVIDDRKFHGNDVY